MLWASAAVLRVPELRSNPDTVSEVSKEALGEGLVAGGGGLLGAGGGLGDFKAPGGSGGPGGGV